MMKLSSFLGFVALLLVNHFHCYKAAGSNNTEPALTCKSYECPSYVTLHKEEGFEIRRYNPTVWMSTSHVMSTSFKEATRTGFLKLYDYVKGNNKEKQKVAMTVPVLTDVFLSNGNLSCQNSTFVVRLSLPKNFTDSPPAASDGMELHPRAWKVRCAAVRAFGGHTTDQNIKTEAKKLEASLVTTPWGSLLPWTNFSDKCLSKETPSIFSVAQYNSPFNNVSRINEIWFTFNSTKGGMCV